MNKIFLLLILTMTCFMLSCEKEEYLKYDNTRKDAVYIDGDSESDSIYYNFGFIPDQERLEKVYVRLMGMPRDYARTFKIRMVNDRYASEEIGAAVSEYFDVPSEMVIGKDSVYTLIPVVLKRHPDLEKKRVILTLELEATEDLDVRGHIEYSITFDDMTPAIPQWWSTSKYGTFTRMKGVLFFKYFHEMEQVNKGVYDRIVKRWDEMLSKGPFRPEYENNPLVVWDAAFKLYVQQKMYDYQKQTGEISGVKDPNSWW